MGQWVSLGKFRTFISSCALKSLACEFWLELDQGGPSEQNLYRIRALLIECSALRLSRTRANKAVSEGC
jgi:hypothetical protein